MDPHSAETWDTIFAKLPSPAGMNSDQICAERVIGDLVGYNHPGGSEKTRKRRQADKNRDSIELKNAMIAFARMYIDAGVRP